ncbi:MAG: HEAT repeat domain-containing protein [Chloroflexi bacterium]|nr:HEAT repeat domain-containing protein [Chloroflexota bacterium]
MPQVKHIFLSYRSLEAEFALRLATDLKNLGVNLWMDRLDIAPGDDWPKTLQKAVNNSLALIAVISPEYISSKYCQRELGRADRLELPVFPVLLKTVPDSDWPIQVENHQYIDFRDWQDENVYRTQLNKLVTILKERFSDQTGLTPNPEMQYINRLIAELEAQRLVVERLEPFSGSDRSGDTRPQPLTTKVWYMPGRFVRESEPDDQPPQRAVPRRAFESIHAVVASYPRFVLTGAPGTGKTAVLRYLVLSAAHAYRATPTAAPLPLFLRLTQWKNEPSFEAFVRAHWPLRGDPIRLLAQGKVSLFLEGLNEIEYDREAKIALLREWLVGPNTPQRVVVTCREADYTPSTDLNLPVVQTVDLNTENIREFVKHYLDEPEASEFLAQVVPTDDNRPQLHYIYQMARNPFLLSALIAVYLRSPDHILPPNMGQLLKRLVDELWASRPSTASDVPFVIVETALADLAFNMIDADMPVYVPQTYVLQNIGQEMILEAALAANLLKSDDNQIRFSHQLLQDYFASLNLDRVGLPTRLSAPQFNQKIQRIPTKWDNAIIILASNAPNPDSVVLNVAEVDPYLALRCALSAVYITERTYRAITRQTLETMQGDRRIALARVFMGIDDEKAMLILFEVMRDAAWPVRQFAATVLGEIELPLLPGLAQAIEDLEDRTRESTLAALRQLGKTALPTLLRLLRSDNWHQRRGAVWALGEMKDKVAVPLLVDSLSDADELVASDAAYALGRIRDSAAIPALLDTLGHQNWRVGKAASKGLAGIGKPAVPALIKILDGKISSPTRQVRAIEALALIEDPDSAAALLDATHAQNVEVRSAAVEGLRNFRGEAIKQRLVECLSDTAKPRSSKQRICDIAAEILDAMSGVDDAVLEQWRKGEAEPKSRAADLPSSKKARVRLEQGKDGYIPLAGNLAAALKDPDWVARRNAVVELANVPPTTAIPHLRLALRDEDSQVRLAAVTTLAIFHEFPGVIEALVEALSDEEYVVCDAAKETLKQVAQPPLPALVDILRGNNVNMRGAAIEILGSIRDTDAVPAVAECLADLRRPWLSDERICDIAARALMAINTPEAAEAVRQWQTLVQASAPPVVVEPPPAPPPAQQDVLSDLLNTLRVKDWNTRQKAAKALSDYAQTLRGVADQSVIQRLVAALSDPDWVVRFATAEALGWFRDRSTVQPLTTLVHDPKWKVRVATIRALAEIGDPAAAETVLEALADPHNLVREAAAEALGNLGNPVAINQLVEAMSDPERFVRLAAIDSVGKMRNPATVNSLITLLNDSDDAVRCYTVYALARIGQVQVIPALIASLDDTAVPYWEDRRICDIAAEALQTIGTPQARRAVQEWQQQQASQNEDT